MADIFVAPFSNSLIRDWPRPHYASLVGLLAARWAGGGTIRVTGAPGQRLAANEIVREADPARVVNECGRLSWDAVVAAIGTAACVIGNNSGIAHLAATLGVPTVCVFGGSHQRIEWRPVGRRVVVLSRVIACSPCHLDHGADCPYDRACLREIAPEEVCAAALALVGS